MKPVSEKQLIQYLAVLGLINRAQEKACEGRLEQSRAFSQVMSRAISDIVVTFLPFERRANILRRADTVRLLTTLSSAKQFGDAWGDDFDRFAGTLRLSNLLRHKACTLSLESPALHVIGEYIDKCYAPWLEADGKPKSEYLSKISYAVSMYQKLREQGYFKAVDITDIAA